MDRGCADYTAILSHAQAGADVPSDDFHRVARHEKVDGDTETGVRRIGSSQELLARACVSRRKQRHGCCLQCTIVKLQQGIGSGAARPVKGAFGRLERCAVKVARTVLRGRGGGNAALLPDQPTREADLVGR
jgi:hypothetical protein